ncbi:MAG TPA: LysR substrate-binding domain-containing protein [Hyphomonas sp.]|nr:hydrogen peroxide-inducible genes activator [Hyphomonas sp.]HRJ00894.1 LysR substrate-binding domain-containing protein [Hyphomonas sp.]HRK68061.1 LysR substrate-binding domain-containing protein [Hyphomonas sp.]
MRPTLRQMQYLIAIADTGKFGDAARQVNVSQPSLSAQVAEMEASLGVQLVERSRRGAMLTIAGQELVRRARNILREVEDLKAVARFGRAELSGRLRLGVLPTIGPYLLPLAASDLHKRFPDLRLSVREERTVDLDEHLQAGEFDTIISSAIDHENVHHEVLFSERLYVCAPAEDPLSHGEGPVRLKDLKGRALLTLGQGHRLNAIIRELAAASGAVVSSEYEGTSLDAIRLMAEMGAGVAVLPSLYALSEARRNKGLNARLIDHPLARREVSLIWRDTSPLAASLQGLAGPLRAAAEKVLRAE